MLCRVETDEPAVALTFDDGPDPDYTERFLNALGDARSTFFSLGESARRWPALIAALAGRGHEIACHGDTHRSLAAHSPGGTKRALIRARDSIAETCGSGPRHYRPAFGYFNLAAWFAAPRLGMRRTLWSGWARDWEETATPELIAARTLDGARPGAILLLHDSDGAPQAPARTLAALPEILHGLTARGLRCVTLTELERLGAS